MCLFFYLIRHEVAEHKSHLQEYKRTPDQPVRPWSFQIQTIFERLNAYERRLHDIQDIFHAANDFFKLEKIEIGGCQGRCLNQKLCDISGEFQTLYNACIAIDYNPLDPSNVQFQCFRQTFQHEVVVLERKLAQVLYEAFDDCYSVEASIKLYEMVGALAQRSTIAAQISIHFERIVAQFSDDIDAVESIFEQHLSTLAANGSIEVLLVHLNSLPFFTFLISFTFKHLNARSDLTERMKYDLYFLLALAETETSAHCWYLKLLSNAPFAIGTRHRTNFIHGILVSGIQYFYCAVF